MTSGSHAIARVTAEAAFVLMMIGNWEASWSGVMAAGGCKRCARSRSSRADELLLAEENARPKSVNDVLKVL